MTTTDTTTMEDHLRDLVAKACRSRDALREENDALREELGVGYETPIQTRRELRAELERLRSELALSRRSRQLLRDQLDQASQQLRIDGYLLRGVIIRACPAMLTDEAAHAIAQTTIDELDRLGPGMLVFRGTPDEPWSTPQRREDTPETNAESESHTDGCTVAPALDPLVLADPDVERREIFGVFRPGSNPADKPVCFAKVSTYDHAKLIADTVARSWISRRVVVTHSWTRVD